MSNRYIWTIKLNIKLYLPKTWLILYSVHPLKKTNFSEVAILITYSILLTAEKLVLTFAMNRLSLYDHRCAFSRNSLHYRQRYGKTRVWGRYNVYKMAGSVRVTFIKITDFCSGWNDLLTQEVILKYINFKCIEPP